MWGSPSSHPESDDQIETVPWNHSSDVRSDCQKKEEIEAPDSMSLNHYKKTRPAGCQMAAWWSGRPAPGACTWCKLAPGSSCTWCTPCTWYKRLVNEYLTAPTRLLHNSCRLSISVYMPPIRGWIQPIKGERAVSERGPKKAWDPKFAAVSAA